MITERKQLRKQKANTSQTSISKDLLDLLIKQQEKDGESALTNQEIVDEFISFFVARMDTTGHLIAMMAYNLHEHEHPEELEKTRSKLSQIQPLDKQWNITIESINKLEQMQLVNKRNFEIQFASVWNFHQAGCDSPYDQWYSG